jgi:hypothetical protein
MSCRRPIHSEQKTAWNSPATTAGANGFDRDDYTRVDDCCNNARKHVTWAAKRMSTTTCACVYIRNTATSRVSKLQSPVSVPCAYRKRRRYAYAYEIWGK